MPTEKYTKTYLEDQLVHIIKEHLRQDNFEPTHLPTYEYLESKGIKTRGLTKAIQRHFDENLTLHDFLKEQGFEGETGDWPTKNQEMVKHLNGYRESRRDRNDDAETTIRTMESAMRWILRASQDLHNIDNLLEYARYDEKKERFVRNKQVEKILDELKENNSGGTFMTYVGYWSSFYQYVEPRTKIDHFPVEQVIDQYRVDLTPEKDVEPLTDSQIEKLWQTAKQLPERNDLPEKIDNLSVRYGIGRLQVYLMTMLLLGISVGPRSIEYERANCHEDWELDDIDQGFSRFQKRKNQPGEVPVLAHPWFLSAYRDYMEKIVEDWNGKPFPNPDNECGSRRKETLNNWLAALCEAADVTLEDGSYPTLQNLRQVWYNEYLDVLRVKNVRLEIVADEAGSKDEKVVEQSYEGDKQKRKMIRDLATKDFEKLIPLEELPDEMSNVIDDEDYIDTQTDLEDF